MPIGNKLTDRYEIKQTLGQGGMGIVYWAYDTQIRRDVALKTIRDAPEKAALELFYKECNILASMSHPNIIEIFDIGKFEDEGAEKPYFVMPLLKGVTLDGLIRNSSRRLTVERTVEILCQTCRGLQAAHERGLVHRDLKPSNLFVLEDDSVKIIDFGVAHMADSHTASAAKGTLLYMAPEQIQLKPATALSDIFTLGVVAYEALTLRRPFDGATHRDIANAILHSIPPPASDLNPAVSPLVGRVVHKTMAKQPWNRFSTARELAEAFQKALRNEPIESFDSARIQPRIERAAKAFESGDHQFASEILTELESEGHLDPAMAPLRHKIDQAVRQKTLSHLLESARIRMDDQEFPLALQKVQEALDIDPENSEALRLQHDIESNRLAFSHARQAVENVLQLQPSDTKALELMTEIERSEQQYLQMRQEKEQLYNSAVELYEKFELSGALSKLERLLELEKRAPEISSSGRGSAYQSLYHQVRSEQDANMSAYSEARRLLADSNFTRALEITEEALKKHPGEALFQALKFDIEDRKRQKLSAYVADVDRSVYAEPDVEKRVDILRGAAEQFPEEQYFARTLTLMKEKRDLVNAIVAKARRQEEQGQYSEALGQWEILRTVYGQYPGLELEIDRVSKRRGQMVSNEGKAHCTERIDRMIERREWAQAAALLRDAQNDFPGDVELEELAKLVKQGEERNARAESLTDQARELSAQKKFDEAVRLLRQAYQSDERNLSVRGLLVETLVQRAQWLLDTDWQRAGEVVQSALELDPGNSQACDLAALVADRTRDEAVEPDVNRARQLQTGGDLTGALGSVEQSMALHPNAPRLHQLRSTLQRSLLDATRAQMRQTDLEILTRLQMQAETEKNPDAQREILSNVRDLAAKYLDDPEFQTALIGVEKRFVLMGRPAAQRVAADTTTKEPRLSLTEVPSPVTKAPGAAPPPVPPVIPPPVPVAKKPAPATPPTPPVAALPPRPPAKPAAQPPKSRKWIAWAVAVPVLLAGAVGAVLLHQRQAPKPAAAPVAGLLAVEIRTSPEGATIQVNEKVSGKSNLQLKLAPGDYRINAVLDGFRPAQTTVNVATGHAASADITLVPLASTLKLITDFPSGSATFDGHPQSNLQSGQLILDKVANGSHLLDFRSGTSGAAIRFDAHAGAPPVVTSVDADKDTSAILITNLGSRARIYSSQKTGSITIDGKPAGPVDPKGVELNDIAPGDHEITVGDGADSRKVVYETAAVPEVTIYLNKGQQTVGMLVVNTGEDDVVVSINGRPGRVTTKRGQLRIPGMSPGDYAISVSKDGFQPVMEQRVTVNKGDEAKVTFQMRPLLKIAALRVAGATPGTQIFVDGKLVGAAGLDGGMATVQVPPGTHRVELRKEDYKTKIYDLTFSPGDNRTLTGADVALEATSATLTVSVSPSNAQLTIQRAGDAQAKPLTAGSAHLAVGQYVVSATLAHYVPHSETFELSGGATKNVSITLAPEKVAVAKPAPVHIGMSGWQDPWQPDGDHFTRRGGNLCLFKPQGPGTYSFTASLKHGKQLRWVARAIDEKNYVEFELDSDTFTRALVVNGKAKELVKRKHGISLQPVEATVQVTITPAGIVQRIQKLGSWSVLDSWTDSTLHEGRFGFLVRGHDEVSLSGFGFTGLE